MSDTHQYPNLPQATWSCWGTSMVPYLQSKNCDQIQFSGGNSGTLKFHHKIPFSAGQFAFSYNYDPGSQTLSLTIDDKPNVVPASAIFGAVQGQIYTCPPE